MKRWQAKPGLAAYFNIYRRRASNSFLAFYLFIYLPKAHTWDVLLGPMCHLSLLWGIVFFLRSLAIFVSHERCMNYCAIAARKFIPNFHFFFVCLPDSGHTFESEIKNAEWFILMRRFGSLWPTVMRVSKIESPLYGLVSAPNLVIPCD